MRLHEVTGEGLNNPHGKAGSGNRLDGIRRKPLIYGPSPNHKGHGGNSEQGTSRVDRSFPRFVLVVISALIVLPTANAVVLYEEGRHIVDGITLLRDKEDPKSYYYLPTSPRVAPRPDGSGPDMFFVKFIDPEGDISGGLVHFLFTLDLPPERVEDLQKKLEKKVAGATIRGPVVLRAEGSEEAGGASFKIISSTLKSSNGKDKFTASLVSSGVAPVTAGSRAAVAARLSKRGATLLWESLTRATSDISVSISASYEAALPAYRGKVSAKLDTVYTHLLKLINRQQGYRKTEIRRIFDELVRSGVIEVDVTDRNGLALNTGQLSGLMNLVTDKLVKMLFDTTTGLSKLPGKEKVSKHLVKGRQKRGWLARLFSGTGDQPYYTDDQYTLRERRDIRRAQFSLVFTHNTTIKVPFESTGNIRGLYELWGEDPRVFRTVNLKDPAFERREVFVEIDPSIYSAFQSQINSVSVSFVKRYRPMLDQDDFTAEVVFNRNDVKKGVFSKSIRYPRLGLTASEWRSYEYRVLWSFRGGKTVGIPEQRSQLLVGDGPFITLLPPLDLDVVEIDADDATLADAQIRRAEVVIQYRALGETKVTRIAISPGRKEILQKVSFLRDPRTKVRYQVRWYSDTGGQKVDGWKPLNGSYLFLRPADS